MIGQKVKYYNYLNREFIIIDKIFKDNRTQYLCIECGYENTTALVYILDPEKICVCEAKLTHI